jgi:hypothetical protein
MQHAKKTTTKVQARNILIRKLSNSNFGANAETKRSAVLALCFSSAEYACSVWGPSAHAN